MLYEIHDPSSYILPDVICDWRFVTISVRLSSIPSSKFLTQRNRLSGKTELRYRVHEGDNRHHSTKYHLLLWAPTKYISSQGAMSQLLISHIVKWGITYWWHRSRRESESRCSKTYSYLLSVTEIISKLGRQYSKELVE